MGYLTYKFTLGQQYSQSSVSIFPHLDGYSMLQALDVESLLHYATLYKGLEHPRIFVYAGGGGAGINPPLVPRDHCIVISSVIQIFWLRLNMLYIKHTRLLWIMIKCMWGVNCFNFLNLLNREASPGVKVKPPSLGTPDSITTALPSAFLLEPGGPGCLLMPQAKEWLSCINLTLLAVEILIAVNTGFCTDANFLSHCLHWQTCPAIQLSRSPGKESM